MFKANVCVSLKKTVADPQGKTVKTALEHLGYKGIEDIRMGKYIDITVSAKDEADARAKVNDMCKKLLVNPIIEDYSFKIEPAK